MKREELGLWIGGCAFLVAMAGGGLLFAAGSQVGKVLAIAGIVGGLIGVVLHFILNWRRILRLE